MGLVDHDHVEGLDRHCRVVGEEFRLERKGRVEQRAFFERWVQAGLTGEDRVEPLDRRDADAGRGPADRVRAEVLDVVEVGEFPAVIRRGVLLELVEGLPAEVSAVDEEQHAPGVGVADHAVDGGDRGECLAGAGRHLDQGAWPVLPERAFEILDRGPLSGPEMRIVDGGWQQLETTRQCRIADVVRRSILGDSVTLVGVGPVSTRFTPPPCNIYPFDQRLGSMEAKDRAASWLRIEVIREPCLDAGALVEHRQWQRPVRNVVGQSLGVDAGLEFDAGQRGSTRFGFDDPDRLLAGDQQVVGFPGSWVTRFAQGDSGPGKEIERLAVLHNPTGQRQLAVDVFACKRFRVGHVGGISSCLRMSSDPIDCTPEPPNPDGGARLPITRNGRTHLDPGWHDVSRDRWSAPTMDGRWMRNLPYARRLCSGRAPVCWSLTPSWRTPPSPMRSPVTIQPVNVHRPRHTWFLHRSGVFAEFLRATSTKRALRCFGGFWAF